MLHFNSRGLLVPNQNIKSSKEEFYEQFVQMISSEMRNDLFIKFKQYSEDLAKQTKIMNPLQWIDGSFTTKELHPNDIDLVTFIPYDIVDKLGNNLNPYKYPESIENYGLDGYIVRVYPQGHDSYGLYAGDRSYWMDHFTKTKISRRGKKFPKGFLEIGTETYQTKNEQF
ncbi:hypothetical protein SAMN00777080_4758 [Aquiflexum balticum DSM 16537]|uniref:Uncharacterized protein n=1 Tax=Aquiflexum balticum DSM 16537 TaxID=758820 RepID=A0A1W2HB04_9BACT|nr:hypothetical protein SAMN00777080_4758 [Aquiflexum balticum DSM 16537]